MRVILIEYLMNFTCLDFKNIPDFNIFLPNDYLTIFWLWESVSLIYEHIKYILFDILLLLINLYVNRNIYIFKRENKRIINNK